MRCAASVRVGSDALIRGYGTLWDKELVDQVTHFNHSKKKEPIKECKKRGPHPFRKQHNAPVRLTKQQPSLLCARPASFTTPHERTSICNAAAKSSGPFSSTLLPSAPPPTFDPASCYERVGDERLRRTGVRSRLLPTCASGGAAPLNSLAFKWIGANKKLAAFCTRPSARLNYTTGSNRLFGGKRERKDDLGRFRSWRERERRSKGGEREIDVWSFDSKSGVKCRLLTYYHTEHVYFKAPVWLLAKLMAGLCVHRGMFYSDGFGPSFTMHHD